MSKYVLTTVVLVAVFLGYAWYQNSSPNAPLEVDDTGASSQNENSAPSSDPNNLNDSEDSVESEVNKIDDTTPSADSADSSTEEANQEADVPNRVTIDMDGFNYEYDVKQIKVKKGDIVTINLKSTEGFHDWVVDEFGAATERINEGETTSVTFTADKVGTFQYYCSVGTHRQQGMVGYIIVEE